MKKVFLRILLFITAVPAIAAIILFLPFYRHLLFNLLVITVSILATREGAKLFQAKGVNLNLLLPCVSSGVLGITAYMQVLGIFGGESTIIAFVLMSFAALFIGLIPRGKDTFSHVLAERSAALFLLVYPGLLVTYLIRITTLPYASFMLLFLILLTFLSDSLAWLFGNLFGRKSKGLIAVSPNKSLVGFAAGFVGTIGIVITTKYLFPRRMPGGLVDMIVLGIILGAAIILGDLFESSLKRSAEIKDSGMIIPGRGGLLDSIDSLLFSAPVFYYFMLLVLSRLA
ncbi:MAG: phosphatidate cytidylyltransferase [Spirochaetia bacterium]